MRTSERGEDPDTSRWRADKALAIRKSQRLRHLVGVNGFFSVLAAESRRREDCDLSLWWSERHCASQFDRIAQPDGLGVWEEAGNRVVFCLEHDRSTETLERQEKKLTSYEDLQVASGLAYRICFCFGHPRREAGARRVLAQAAVPVATAALGRTQRPQDAIWAPVGDEGLRLRLAELAAVPVPPESEERIAEPQAYRRRAAEPVAPETKAFARRSSKVGGAITSALSDRRERSSPEGAGGQVSRKEPHDYAPLVSSNSPS
jgi:hypothetical protein